MESRNPPPRKSSRAVISAKIDLSVASAATWGSVPLPSSSFTETYDVVVVGAGHAGCEAAMAAARMGLKTALFTLNVDLIAQMSCNPAIGGIAKGHLVREVDALGGIMGEVTDAVGIQFRSAEYFAWAGSVVSAGAVRQATVPAEDARTAGVGA